jgi:hypothetical protein
MIALSGRASAEGDSDASKGAVAEKLTRTRLPRDDKPKCRPRLLNRFPEVLSVPENLQPPPFSGEPATLLPQLPLQLPPPPPPAVIEGLSEQQAKETALKEFRLGSEGHASPLLGGYAKPKRKSKNKNRNKKRGGSDSGIRVGGAVVPPELPDAILMPTFERVMSLGLVLGLTDASGKRADMFFSMARGGLKWRRKASGSERGCLLLSDLAAVEDAGGLELRLRATAGEAIQLGASSGMEKALLLRSFQLLLNAPW